MNSEQQNIDCLIEYLRGLLSGESDGKNLYEQYRENLELATPQQAFAAFNSLFHSGVPADRLLTILDKAINAMHRSLKEYKQESFKQGSFLYYLDLENKGLLVRLADLRQIFTGGDSNRRQLLLAALKDIAVFKDHYVKKENILFPYLEKKNDYFRGLGIMWALHDLVRSRLKTAAESLQDPGIPDQEINMIIGRLIFALHGMVLKEELILFPAALSVISPHEWQDMQTQSLDYNFPFVSKPPVPGNNYHDEELSGTNAKAEAIAEFYYRTETGELDQVQLECLLSTLPVDLTYVDENNRVSYFSRPKERIFPRSPAIIGRAVENCHPPHSVDKVMQIIAAFRQGNKDKATFWIQLKGRFILIQYFALRDKRGSYKGTLEVSQDISEIRHLEGEKRLLAWDEE